MDGQLPLNHVAPGQHHDDDDGDVFDDDDDDDDDIDVNDDDDEDYPNRGGSGRLCEQSHLLFLLLALNNHH